MVQFEVGWPPKELNPNARRHWSVKSRAARRYRKACNAYAHNALAASNGVAQGRLILALVFCPPDRRKRDDDNLVAAFKSGRDGIADALGIDDSQFVTQFEIGQPVKGGAVRVTITSKDAE